MHTDLQGYLPLVASGKVREIYELDQSTLLFVATDRISAYDVVMKNGIEQKGAILTQLSQFWFKLLQSKIPALRTHYISMNIPQALQERLPAEVNSQLQRRSMVVQRLKVFPIESIVRGYITGSAWSSYQKNGTVCDNALPTGLRESERLPQPLWTPSTKAEAGGKDENISPSEAARIVGQAYANQIEQLSLELYEKANTYAAQQGIIIADTKFEFGLDESTTPAAVVLIDEVLTPDSSRFWSAEKYEVGRGQESYDKQYLRDWLVKNGLRGKEMVEMPDDVALKTIDRYEKAYRNIVGKGWDAGASAGADAASEAAA
ncbi:Bifunctional purine biosynthetic protein ade1 [Imshaugia aleurites]|uniref:Phosphoribosylaminoimidazole-succinocarboxamide synthase n=1 Tax=Imshaugia aleurites TaxID=172621 RepID=A0A8H3FI86_9LECA|nr:Bifunctional purine biosynthetic protein ade1 [Imshaugia aleurites]